MKLFLVILSFGLALAETSNVEIVKQRLIRFPVEPAENQTTEQADETRRILNEISKINAALGYIKRQEGQHRHRPVLLDSNTYLYPKPSSPPIEWKFEHSAERPTDIRFGLQSQQQYQIPQTYQQYRSVEPAYYNQHLQAPIARKIIHQHSVMIPPPFNNQGYYYPEPYLRAPLHNTPRSFQNNDSKTDSLASNLLAISNDITSIIEYARNIETHDVDISAANNEEFENKLLDSVQKIVSEAREKKSKSHVVSKVGTIAENKQSNNVKYVAVPSNVQSVPGIIVTRRPPTTTAATTQKSTQEFKPLAIQTKPTSSHTQTETQRLFHKQKLSQPQKVSSIQSTKHEIAAAQASVNEQSQSIGQVQQIPPNVTKTIQLKNPFSILSKPLPQLFRRQTTPAPLPLPIQPIQTIDNDDPDYDSDESYSGNYQASAEKGIFQQALDNQKEVLKSGGVLIQKLRVRKGGIAIAGPGGVATAGSGGTAIIGPGGVALTHPRSLTIAGPGAKVVALPVTYDLEKAIWETSARSLPAEGVVVATGPTIYYSP